MQLVPLDSLGKPRGSLCGSPNPVSLPVRAPHSNGDALVPDTYEVLSHSHGRHSASVSFFVEKMC